MCAPSDCSVGFLASNKHAVDMRSILNRLETVSAHEATRRQRVAARLRGAFVQREGATFDAPSAAHYIVAAMCARARRTRNVTRCGHGHHHRADREDAREGERGRAATSRSARKEEGAANGKTPRACLPGP